MVLLITYCSNVPSKAVRHYGAHTPSDKENAPWHWSDEPDSAFQRIKQMVTQAPMLTYYNPHGDLTIQCDARQNGLFSFNDYIHSTSHRLCLFDKYIHSTSTCARRIHVFIQLQRPKLCFTEQIYLFNFNKNIFIQQNIFSQLFATSQTLINSYSQSSTSLPPCYPFLTKKSMIWKQNVEKQHGRP